MATRPTRQQVDGMAMAQVQRGYQVQIWPASPKAFSFGSISTSKLTSNDAQAR